MHRRISRRSLLSKSLFASIGATGLALVGCGDKEPRPVRTPSPATPQRQEDQQQAGPDFGLPSELAEPRQQERQTENALAGVTAALPPPKTLVDPFEWRERYHWRKLRGAPGRPTAPASGGSLAFFAPSSGDWHPLAPMHPLGVSLLPLFYNQLVEMAADDENNAHRNAIRGDLVESWETPDAQTIVFAIHGGAIWPEVGGLESRELTAEDVRATHELFRAEDGALGRTYADLERVEADAGGRRAAFHLAAPNAPLLNQMTSPRHVVVRSEIVLDRDRWDLLETPAGTGPFVLMSSSASTGLGGWEAERNPTYFKRDERGVQLPYLDAVRSRPPGFASSDQDEFRDAFFRTWRYDGGFDQLQLLGPDEHAQALEARPEAVTQVSPPTPGAAPTLQFASLAEPPFNDARVRIALSRSLDRALLAEQAYGGLAAPDCGQNWTFVADSSSDWGFREWPWTAAELGETFTSDPAAARALLDAAGYDSRNPLSIRLDAPAEDSPLLGATFPEHEPLTDTIEFALRESLGSAAAVERAPREVVRGSQGAITTYSIRVNDASNLRFRRSGLFDYAIDPDDLVYAAMRTDGTQNSAGFSDAEIDALAEAQRRALDPLERSELLEQIRYREAEEVWRLHLVNPYGLSVRREYVFDKVDTYFAKSIEQRPRQLERVWRST